MLVELLGGILAILLLLYGLLSWKWTFWTSRGVYQMETKFPFGTLTAFFTKKVHHNVIFKQEAEIAKDLPFYGGYFLHAPVFMIKDPDLVRLILIKDFDHFVDRNSSSLAKLFKNGMKTDEIWGKQLTNLTGDEWKSLRSTFTPIFTAGKMKAMLIFMQETCNTLVSCIDEHVKNNEDFELKDMLGKYSLDTIASAAFGVNAESFSNDKSLFLQYASNIFKSKLSDALKIGLGMIPGVLNIFKALDISIMKKTETEFFYQAIMSTLNHRREHKSRRNDLIDLMVDAIKEDMEHTHDEDEQFEKVFLLCIYCMSIINQVSTIKKKYATYYTILKYS